jgi:hypothetical protein
MRLLLIDNGIFFDNFLLLQRQVESVAMACFVGVAELPVSHSHHLFLIEALVGD